MVRQKFLYAGLGGYVFGVAVASIKSDFKIDVWLLLLLATSLAVIALRKGMRSHSKYLLVISMCMIVFSLGVWRTGVYVDSISTYLWPEGETSTIEGVVVKEPDERAFSTHYYVKSNEQVILVTTDRYQNIEYGDLVRVTGKIKTPTSFETELGRTFNYPGYLKTRSVLQTMQYADVEVTGKDYAQPIIATLLTVKASMLRSIETHLPEPQAGLAEGLLLGVKRALGDELEKIFRSTGIIHIVVLSGYNIMLVVAFVLYVLSFIFPWRGRLLVGLVAIVAFAAMVGLNATVVRASLMAALALVARGIGRTYSVIQALLLAGFVMLLINPYLLVFDVGFQLSFLATLGLILVAPVMERTFKKVPAVIGMREFLIATLATQVFVLPILLYQIGEFSVVSVLVNVLVLPLVPVAMLATFLMVVSASVWSYAGLPFMYIAYGALTYIIKVPTVISAFPFASMMVPAFPVWIVFVSYLFIGYVVYRFYWPRDELDSWTIEEDTSDEVPSVEAKKVIIDTPVFFQ